MALVLTITNVDALDNGEPTRMSLDRHGMIIGRSPHADWSLPDPKSYVSSTHCEIDYRDGAYLLIDKSTNGTFVNGASERLAGPHVLKSGDVLSLGHYRVAVRLDGAAATAASAAHPPADAGALAAGWGDWGSPTGTGPAASSDWGPTPAKPASPSAAPAQAWAAPVNPAPPPSSAWGDVGTPVGGGAPSWDNADLNTGSAVSGRGAMAQHWSAPASAPTAPADDPWSALSAGDSIDWARGFGGASSSPAPAPPTPAASAGWASADPAPAWGAPPMAPAPKPATPDPFGLPSATPPTPALAPAFPPPPPPQPVAPPVARAPGGDQAWAALLAAAGVSAQDVEGSPDQAAAAAGEILRLAVGGLVVMLEARTRAKAQLGAQATTMELNGNNPLKWTASPEKAVAQLINAPVRGFMPAGRAIEDAFQDLQAHQMATLAAMQGALRSTLARFSPEAIRQRAETRGLMARILPAAREAALWQAYEREFEGVAKGSDEAFMDVFAKAFKQAYEDAAAGMKRR